MKSSKKEAGAAPGISLAADVVLKVNPSASSRSATRPGEPDGRGRQVTAVADDPAELSTLRTEERALVELADGRRTVAELARLAGLPHPVAIAHLRALCDRGVLMAAEPDGNHDGEADRAGPGRADRTEAATEPGPRAPRPAQPARPSSSPESMTVHVDYHELAGRPGAPAPEPGFAALDEATPPRPGTVVPKKPTTGPNVTLFWLPSQLDPEGSAATGAPVPAAPDSGPESTVVVVKGSPPAAAGAQPPSSSPVPFRVGGYEVATRLAQGAMGSIYVCRRVGTAGIQRLFTLKVIREHSAQKDLAMKSFMREARVGALLSHPNVQALVDYGTYEEQPFLILDYIEGASLSDLLTDDARAPAPVAVSILLDVLRGLQHVHGVVDLQGTRLGLVHGDVSPQNILVGLDGAARLTDFGSARFTAEPKTSEADLVAVGKPAYMAPEQLRGEPTDARTDVFSAGIAMWTALTGQRLFAAETYDQTVMKVLRRKIPPPSELGAPACLDPIVLRALHRSPEGRYASADEMAAEILKVATTEDLVAPARDVGEWVRRQTGEALADRRRKIQDVFGTGAGSSRRGGRAGYPTPPATPQGTTPMTGSPIGAVAAGLGGTTSGATAGATGATAADGSRRLAAKTVQLGDIAARVAAAVARRRAAPQEADGSTAASGEPRATAASRAQWYLVVFSAVLATGALVIAIAYFMSNLSAPPNRAKTPASWPASPPPATTAPRAAQGPDPAAAPEPARPATAPGAAVLDPSRGP